MEKNKKTLPPAEESVEKNAAENKKTAPTDVMAEGDTLILDEKTVPAPLVDEEIQLESIKEEPVLALDEALVLEEARIPGLGMAVASKEVPVKEATPEPTEEPSPEPVDTDEALSDMTPAPVEKPKPKPKKQGNASLGRMVVTLTGICTAVALLLSVVNVVTEDVILENQRKKQSDAILQIFADGTDVKQSGDNRWLVYKGEELLGYCVAVAPSGYVDNIGMMVGIDTDKQVVGIQITAMSETAGVGTKTRAQSFLEQFTGQSGPFVVGENVDAIVGASVSSRAVTEGVNMALAMGDEPVVTPDETQLPETETEPPETVPVMETETETETETTVETETETETETEAPVETETETRPPETQPETKKPETIPPETIPPVETQPETQAPVETEPETQAPVETEPETQAPVETEPETQVPVETEPETQAPVETEPETQAPVETESETLVPVETEPETLAPVETEPETQAPVETEPETEAPIETEPETEPPVETEPETEAPVETEPETEAPVETKEETKKPAGNKKPIR